MFKNEFYLFTYTSIIYCKINLSDFLLIGYAPFAGLHFLQQTIKDTIFSIFATHLLTFPVSPSDILLKLKLSKNDLFVLFFF